MTLDLQAGSTACSLLYTSLAENLLHIVEQYFVVLEAMLTPLGLTTRSTHIKGVAGRRRGSIQHHVVTYVAMEAEWHLQQGCKIEITHTADAHCKGEEANTACGRTTQSIHTNSTHILCSYSTCTTHKTQRNKHLANLGAFCIIRIML